MYRWHEFTKRHGARKSTSAAMPLQLILQTSALRPGQEEAVRLLLRSAANPDHRYSHLDKTWIPEDHHSLVVFTPSIRGPNSPILGTWGQRISHRNRAPQDANLLVDLGDGRFCKLSAMLTSLCGASVVEEWQDSTHGCRCARAPWCAPKTQPIHF